MARVSRMRTALTATTCQQEGLSFFAKVRPSCIKKQFSAVRIREIRATRSIRDLVEYEAVGAYSHRE